MRRLPIGSAHAGRSLASGANASSSNGSPGWRISPGPAAPGPFPPEVVVHVKALACEMPSAVDAPFARWSVAELASHVRRSGLVASISDTTIWRWLDEDAIRPWRHRCWIFPRDPDFAEKAGRILDLYQRIWKGRRLGEDEFVISADEKTSIQARARKHPSLPPMPGAPMRIEHEYKRMGAWAYLAALDVHRSRIFGRCDKGSTIVAFDHLVAQVMRRQPYRDARRVFWIVDNGTAHRGIAAVDRLRKNYPNLVLVHGPVHASWLNQIEIYFSILQRKALTPNDFESLEALSQRILAFERHFQTIAKPFEWRFTRKDLADLLRRLDHHLPKAA